MYSLLYSVTQNIRARFFEEIRGYIWAYVIELQNILYTA